MKGTIFLRTANGKLAPMKEADYVSEGELQRLLATYADLLPGDQIDPEAPRRWLFVGREVGVPGAEGESDWLSLDHLFIDQDGIPTFVECKRAADTRARREVVAQMLDYAANGTVYWTVARLQELAAATNVGASTLDEQVSLLIDAESQAEVDAYWQQVSENLKRGKVRLMFVLDEAPAELRRLVEFLNEQMTETEVLILEVKQFKGGDDLHALVPRLLGRTEKSAEKHSPRAAKVTVPQVLDALQARSAEEGQIGKEILDSLKALGASIETTSKGFVPVFSENDRRVHSIRVGRDGRITVFFHLIRQAQAFANPDTRRELLDRIRRIAGADYPDEKIDGKISFALSRLSDSAVMTEFKATMQWFISRLASGQAIR